MEFVHVLPVLLWLTMHVSVHLVNQLLEMLTVPHHWQMFSSIVVIFSVCKTLLQTDIKV
jgi:hypothetical protein